MNSTDILPSHFLRSLYYYYSYFTLAATWLITPLLVYVVLTQSKDMKTFKWLILNHSFWCLLFQTFFSILKPVFLTPLFWGYPLGLARNGSFISTLIFTVLVAVLLTFSLISLILTIFCRYLFVFPSSMARIFGRKPFLILALILTLSLCIYMIITVFTNIIFIKDFYQITLNENPALEYLVLHEPGLVYCPYTLVETPLLIITILVFGVLICALGFIIFFFHLFSTFTSSSTTVSKLKKSLLLSIAVQTSILFFLFYIPIFCLAMASYFRIPNSSNFVCFTFCLWATHSFAESLSTLLLVAPYRKFVIKFYTKMFLCRIPKSKVKMISVNIQSIALTIS